MDGDNKLRPIQILLSASLCVASGSVDASRPVEEPQPECNQPSSVRTFDAKWQVLRSAYRAGGSPAEVVDALQGTQPVSVFDEFRNIAWSNT